MTPRKLTPNEIKGLFLFCRKQKVKYYDVQLELVDHLASCIEEIWKTQPEIQFQDALTKIYLSFGVNGFLNVEKTKKKELRKKYSRLIWTYLIEFYRLPKIIFTIFLVAALFFAFKSVTDLAMLNVAFLAFSFIGLLSFYTINYKRKIKIDLTQKMSFLLLDYSNAMAVSMIGSIFLLFDVVLLVTSFPNIIGYQIPSGNLTYLVLSFFYVLALLVVWVSWVYIPQQIKADFIREYPQFVKA
jgi:hypothetical protein